MIRINSFSTDTGVIGDGITSDNTLTLTGTATGGSLVSLYNGTTLLGTARADANGAWSYNTNTLQDGAYNFTATQTTTTTSPSPSGFPDASTTGVPTGTSLTNVNGDFTTSYAGQIIDARNVNGTIIVNHPGVIIRNCQADYITVNADGCRIVDTTVVGENTGGSGINLFSTNAIVERVDISGVENGIWLEGNGNLIRDNYIHDLRNDVYFDPHFDGLQIGPGTTTANNVIDHNNFDLGEGTNACIMIEDGTNIDISNNRFHGGTYNIYFEDNTTGCDVTNNVFAYNLYGDVEGTAAGAQTYSGNVDGETSARTTSTTTTETSPPLAVTVDTTPTDGGGGTGGGTPAPDDSNVDFTNVQQRADDKVVFKGTADAGDRITVHDSDGTVVGTAKAKADGTFSLTTSSALSDDVVHHFTTTVTDSAGHSVPTSGSVVLGTSHSDRLTGTSGDDLFRGNGGFDTFEFRGNFGNDVITDFAAANRRNHDIVDFRDTSFHNFADVMAHASQHGQDVVIDDGAGNSLTLRNTALSNLDRNDFHFA